MHEGRIDVFNPKGLFVTEIELPRKISERPCRIDIDSRGRIYIAARPLAVTSVGNIDIEAHPHATAFRYAVLRYTPDSYPPRARTEYGLPIIFALWGEVYGVAVDPSDGHVYAASEAVHEYSPRGKLLHAADEVQLVVVDAKGGTFTLTFQGNTTKPIPYDASAATVEEALEGLMNIGKGNVAVNGKPGGRSRYTVTFTGELSDRELEQMECDSSRRTGGGESCAVTTTTEGNEGAIGFGGRDVAVWGRNHDVFVSVEGAEGEAGVVNIYDGKDHRLSETIRGASGDSLPPYPSIAVDQANGDVYVEDFKSHRVKQFGKDRKSGRYELVASIRYGEYLGRPEAGADLAVDGSPESPNQGYLFVTSEAGSGGHVYAFAPVGGL